MPAEDMGIELNTAKCDLAQQQAGLWRHDAEMWLGFVRWVGAATAIASVVLIAAAVAGADIAKNVAAVGTVVAGAGFAFVIRQRNVAVKRYHDSLKDVARYCGDADVRRSLLEE